MIIVWSLVAESLFAQSFGFTVYLNDIKEEFCK